jgi:hypothetical protein
MRDLTPSSETAMNRLTTHRRAFVCAAIALALGGCSTRPARPADIPALYYYDLGDTWKTRKRRVHLYACRSGSMVCTGPASYLDVMYDCGCE